MTYDNVANTDGIGAQLQRVYGIYAISRGIGTSYLHSPLTHVGYQGWGAVEREMIDPELHREANRIFQIDSDLVPRDLCGPLRLTHISEEAVQVLAAMFDRGETCGRTLLVEVLLPYGITDARPDYYEVCKPLSPFAPEPRGGRPWRIALHVRHGDLFVVTTDRRLPNAYYVNVASRIAQALEARGIDYEIELWTEVPERSTVHPDETTRAPVAVAPGIGDLDEFSVLPNLVHRINDSAIECIRGFATADVLVLSRSSLSYFAALLNRDGIIVYHPFWHSPLSSWVIADCDGGLDEHRLQQTVNELR